jgi:hypothetical protein
MELNTVSESERIARNKIMNEYTRLILEALLKKQDGNHEDTIKTSITLRDCCQQNPIFHDRIEAIEV